MRSNNTAHSFQSDHRQMNSVYHYSSLYKASEAVDFSKLLLIVLQKWLMLVIEIDYLIIYMIFSSTRLMVVAYLKKYHHIIIWT